MKNVLIFNKFLVYNDSHLNCSPPPGGGGTGMIKWGQKSNPKKFLNQNLTPQKSHAEFPSHKNFQRNYAAGMRGNYHEASDCSEYQKKSFLKSSYPKNTCRNFPNQKKSQNCKFQTPKNPSINTVTWNQEYPPPPPPGMLTTIGVSFAAVIVSSRNAPPLFGRSAVWKKAAMESAHNHQFTSFLWHHPHAQNKGAY